MDRLLNAHVKTLTVNGQHQRQVRVTNAEIDFGPVAKLFFECLPDLSTYRARFGLGVERDRFFTAKGPASRDIDAACKRERITQVINAAAENASRHGDG